MLIAVASDTSKFSQAEYEGKIFFKGKKSHKLTKAPAE